MKRKLGHFVLSMIFYCVLARYAKSIFVIPPDGVELTPFLPPILGLIWGYVGIFGCVAGEILARNGQPEYIGIAVVFLAAYLPRRLWFLVWLNKNEPVFAFNRNTLKKYIFVLFVTIGINALILGFNRTGDDIAQILAGTYMQSVSAADFAAILFLNDFNIALFFGMPIFFILISYRYPFAMPSTEYAAMSESNYEINRSPVVLLYAFFLGLFVILNASGIIYDLDNMDTWLRFNGEILTAMNITMIALFYMLIKYRHSIMTYLMLMELSAIFAAAFLLGSISFVTLSRTIDEHVSNDLQKMSVIYRERLARTFNDTIMAANSMSRLAANELESRERFMNDTAYRANYLTTMQRNFSAIAENSPGSIGFYMHFPKEITKDGFLCIRKPENWGNKLPEFTLYDGEDNNRYHIPEEKYLAKLSEPYFNDGAGRYMVSYVVPLHKNDKFVGIVGIDIDFDYIIHEIKRMSVYEHGIVRLLDKNGDLLYANRPDSVASLNGKRGFYETETYLSTGIWLTIAAFAHDIYADRNNMLIHFVVGMLFIVVVVSFFSIWLAQKGIQPLMLITKAAKNIAAGDLNVHLPQNSKNELGILVNSIREMVSKLEEYVYHDKLTGLRNVAAYMRKAAELDDLRQNKGQVIQYGVVVFDANYLKRVNDTYGHEAGNELIRRAARIICEVFAHSPVFRIGGDEFAAILEHHDYEHREELIAEFDEKTAAASFEVDGAILPVSVARGLGVFRQDMEYSAVFQEADDAMYQHKASLKAQRE